MLSRNPGLSIASAKIGQLQQSPEQKDAGCYGSSTSEPMVFMTLEVGTFAYGLIKYSTEV